MNRSSVPASIVALAQSLIAAEQAVGGKGAPDGRAAFRICEKLRRPLCVFAGTAGYRSLLMRALSLAKTEAPYLAGMKIQTDGSLQYSAEMEALRDTPEAAQAGIALVGHLLGLLVTFVGEPLSLRLVHEVWPNAAPKDRKLKEHQP